MKTLCYKIAFRSEGWIYNEGNIIIEIDDNNNAVNLEGVLTCDYIKSVITDSEFIIQFYSYDEYCEPIDRDDDEIILLENSRLPMILYLELAIPIKEVEFPLNRKFNFEDGGHCEIETLYDYSNGYQLEKEQLEVFKHKVFKEGRI